MTDNTKYTCVGSVRGCCGIKHRSLETALKCCDRDQKDCRSARGYSDRRPVSLDLVPLHIMSR